MRTHMVVLALSVAGCFAEAREVAAATGYEAQQLRCVEQYGDRASIDRCRARVKAAWTVDSGLYPSSEVYPTDGGK